MGGPHALSCLRRPHSGMRTGKTWARRRCGSCRKWYRPHRLAEGHQRSCSGACGAARRRRTACLRREKDLQDFRVEERRRQRECRERRRQAEPLPGAVESVAEAVSEEVSRAGFRSETAELEQVILEIWDKSARLSRAGLQRNLQALPGRSRGKLGQGGTRDPLCHTQASFPKSFGF